MLNNLYLLASLKKFMRLFTGRLLLLLISCLAGSTCFLACEKALPPASPVEIGYADLRDRQYAGKRVVVQGYLRLGSTVLVLEEKDRRTCDILLDDKPLSQAQVKASAEKPEDFKVNLTIKVGDHPYNLQPPPVVYSQADLKVRTPTKIVGADDLVKVFARVRWVLDSSCNLEVERVEPVVALPTEEAPGKAKNPGIDPVKKIPEKKSAQKEKSQ